MPPMHIVTFEAENVKRLKWARITPQGRVVQITGANGSGKSSVLDSILYALLGVGNLPAAPVRRGEQRATIKLDFGTITVIRRIPAKGNPTLEVWSNETKTQFGGGQGFLNQLLPAISFDPVAFKRMDPTAQLETLRGLVDVGVDLDEMDAESQAEYDRRREMTRELNPLTARLKEFQVEEGLPDRPVSLEELADQMQEAIAANQERGAVQAKVERLEQEERRLTQVARDFRDAAEVLREQVRNLEKAIADNEHLARDAERAAAAQVATRQSIEVPAYIETDELALRIRSAETINRKIAVQQARDRLQVEHDSIAGEVERLSESIARRRARVAELIADAEMPIPGLGFGEGHVLYNGLPLDQASDAEQIRVSVAIGMAANPTIRIMCIRDGSLLDNKGMAQIGEMAEKNNFQIFLERVDTSGKVGIVMEDGEVAGAPDSHR